MYEYIIVTLTNGATLKVDTAETTEIGDVDLSEATNGTTWEAMARLGARNHHMSLRVVTTDGAPAMIVLGSIVSMEWRSPNHGPLETSS